MDFQTFGRIPAEYDQQVVTDAATYKLEQTKFNYALVQFQETAVGDYTEPSRIGRYRVDGVAPTLSQGFIAGDGDTRIFTNGEIKAGVQLLSAEAGKSFTVVVEYYNKL
jgi:hypothetical protein